MHQSLELPHTSRLAVIRDRGYSVHQSLELPHTSRLVVIGRADEFHNIHRGGGYELFGS